MTINETNNEHLPALAHYDRFDSKCMHVKAFFTNFWYFWNVMLLTTNELLYWKTSILFFLWITLFFFKVKLKAWLLFVWWQYSEEQAVWQEPTASLLSGLEFLCIQQSVLFSKTRRSQLSKMVVLCPQKFFMWDLKALLSQKIILHCHETFLSFFLPSQKCSIRRQPGSDIVNHILSSSISFILNTSNFFFSDKSTITISFRI